MDDFEEQSEWHSLSIKQPWVWLILKEYKKIENRSKSIPLKYENKWIALHVSKKQYTNTERSNIYSSKYITECLQSENINISNKNEIFSFFNKLKWETCIVGLIKFSDCEKNNIDPKKIDSKFTNYPIKTNNHWKINDVVSFFDYGIEPIKNFKGFVNFPIIKDQNIKKKLNNFLEIIYDKKKMSPNLKFDKVPIIEVPIIKTANFIQTVTDFSKRNDVKKAGGFFVIRPEKTHKFLIPTKTKSFNPKNHNHSKHYFINHERNDLIKLPNNNSNKIKKKQIKPLNKNWLYDIPGLDKKIKNKSLIVGSYPQKCCFPLDPIFSINGAKQISMVDLFEYNQKKNKEKKEKLNQNYNNNNNEIEMKSNNNNYFDSVSHERKEIDKFRGFSYVVNQYDGNDKKVDDFWKTDKFEADLIKTPYDNASAEEIPLIFAQALSNDV